MIIKGEDRKVFGKGLTEERRKGLTPGVLYGEKLTPASFFVKERELRTVFNREGKSGVIEFELGSEKSAKKYKVLIKEIQIHPATDLITHVDFYQVPTRRITLKVPIVVIGKSEAESNGALIMRNHRELSVVGLMEFIPRELTIDVSVIQKIGDEIKVKDIALPKDVAIKESPEEVVIFAMMPKQEAVKEPEATVTATTEAGAPATGATPEGSATDTKQTAKEEPKK